MKKIKFTSVVSAIFAILGLASWLKAAEPMGHWKFDEGGGLVAKDSAGGWNNAKVKGAKWIKNKSRSCLKLGDKIDELTYTHVEFPLKGVKREKMAEGGFSIWLKPIDGGTIDPQYGMGLAVQQLYIGVANGKWMGNMRDGRPETGIAYIVGPKVTDEWTHLALTWNGMVLRFFVNGEEVLNQGYPYLLQQCRFANRFISKDGEMYAGSLDPMPNRLRPCPFKGYVDEMKYFSKFLTPEEIRADYETEKDNREITND